MTTPDSQGAGIPASPAAAGDGLAVVAWRTRHQSEPAMIGHYPWSYTERKWNTAKFPSYEMESLVRQSDAQAIIDRQASELVDMRSRWNAAEEEFAASLKAARPDTEAIMAVFSAGDSMSNVMFNLAQKFDPVLFTRRECEMFRLMQIKWDETRSSLRRALAGEGP